MQWYYVVCFYLFKTTYSIYAMFKHCSSPWKCKRDLDTILTLREFTLSWAILHRIAIIKFLFLTLTILLFTLCSFSCMEENFEYLFLYQIIQWFCWIFYDLQFSSLLWYSVGTEHFWQVFSTILARSLIIGIVMAEQK